MVRESCHCGQIAKVCSIIVISVNYKQNAQRERRRRSTSASTTALQWFEYLQGLWPPPIPLLMITILLADGTSLIFSYTR